MMDKRDTEQILASLANDSSKIIASPLLVLKFPRRSQASEVQWRCVVFHALMNWTLIHYPHSIDLAYLCIYISSIVPSMMTSLV